MTIVVPPLTEPVADAMMRLADPDILRRFTVEARRRKDRNTIAGMADETEEIYFELLGYRSPALLRMGETALQLQA